MQHCIICVNDELALRVWREVKKFAHPDLAAILFNFNSGGARDWPPA
jgi:hypothetical protein